MWRGAKASGGRLKAELKIIQKKWHAVREVCATRHDKKRAAPRGVGLKNRESIWYKKGRTE